jgi:hypothetical protein
MSKLVRLRPYNSSSSGSGWFPVVMYLVAMAVIVLVFGMRGSCADESEAVTAAENFGFTEVKVLDKSIWFVGFRGCDAKDAAVFEVRGKNPAGKVVQISVCVGWPFKGATVRSQ